MRDRAGEAGPKPPAAILGLGLALLVVALYRPALDAGFVNFDDPLYVDHPRIQAGLSWENAGWAFTHVVAFNWHPLTVISHMADRSLFGVNPRGHHLTSVMIHALNVALLFAFLHGATGATGRSFAVAALWGLHPLRVESVAWVAERKDVLCGLFWLLTLLAYTAWIRRRTAGRYLAVGALLAAALLAKPMAVTLPCVLLLLDVWPHRRLEPGSALRPSSPSSPRALRDLVVEKLPWLALVAAASWATVRAQGEIVAGSGIIPLADRLATAVMAVGAYAAQTFVPVGLSPYYPYRFQIPLWQVGLTAAALAAVTAGVWLLGRRNRAVAVGWLWFLGTLVPVCGLLPVGAQARADRYTYLPSIGLLIAVVWAIPPRWLERPRRLAALLLAGSLLALGAITHRQIGYWRDSVTLFRHAIAVSGPSLLTVTNLAGGLAAQGRHAEAEPEFRRAIALAPREAALRRELGLTLLALDRPRDALHELETALRLDPEDPVTQRAAALARSR